MIFIRFIICRINQLLLKEGIFPHFFLHLSWIQAHPNKFREKFNSHISFILFITFLYFSPLVKNMFYYCTFYQWACSNIVVIVWVSSQLGCLELWRFELCHAEMSYVQAPLHPIRFISTISHFLLHEFVLSKFSVHLNSQCRRTE